MKKTLLAMIMAMAVYGQSLAQTNTFPTTGNVGIGTTSPTAGLDIADVSNGLYNFRVTGGYTNFNSTTVRHTYGTSGHLWDITYGDMTAFSYHDGTAWSSNRITFDKLGNIGITGNLSASGSGTNYFAGNVGIGTTSPAYSLDIQKSTASLNLNGSGFGNSGALINLLGWAASSKNWQIGVANIGYDGLMFSPSTSIGGATFTTPAMIINSNGNVGIGTVAPGAKLDVENGTALVNTDALAALGGQLTISNNYGNQNGAVRLNLNNGGAVSWIKGIVTGPNTNTGSAMAFGVPSVTADGAEAMRITSNGSLAIGTIDPGSYKLAVNGTIHSKAVIIDLIGWPDYVFKKDYQLMPLSSVKSYIDQNHHLPEMPTDKEVESKGLDVGEMNKLLTKKVEELTLYLIEKDKQLKEITEKQQEQDNANQKLSEQLKTIQAQLNQQK